MTKVTPAPTEKTTVKDEPRQVASDVIQLNEPENPIDYDVEELQKFIDFVFQEADPDEDENVLIWYSKTNVPYLPTTEDAALRHLAHTHNPYALYFGTATCMKNPDDNRLYNRKKLFKQLHVVVLDDIGTKIPMDTLPEALKPSYIIETSAGNYQYGFVLSEPVDNLAHAQALIHLAYTSGYSDAGGGMPTKAVRLPGGVNGKEGAKKGFKVNLKHMDGPKWTPADLLLALGVDETWEYVQENTAAIVNRNVGTSPWSPVAAQAASMLGVIDPVLEWLYTKGRVKSENDEWVTILCPWAHNHTKGDEGSYSPLGRGEGRHKEYRGFHCFHDGCSGAPKGHNKKGITDFLQDVAAQGGPEAAVHDPAARLVAEWAFDCTTDTVWQIRDGQQPRSISMQAFKHTFPNKLQVINSAGKTKLVGQTNLWMVSPSRVIVSGRTFDPTTSSKLVRRGEDLLINMFYHPEWGAGTYDKADVKMFEDFLAYLLPTPEEREYFTDWLSAKCQNLGFRGAGILMIAKQQGTGRTTLSDMIETLIGTENTENVPFNRLTGDGVFNEWMEKPLVVTNETKDTSDTKSYYKVYEGLKEYVDPRPKRERINPKYGQQRISMVYSSYLMFSNHDNALAVAGNDRRFYVMRNASQPATPNFFTRLNAWLERLDDDGKPKWAKSIWRWLQTREVDVEAMLAPAPMTAAKRAMISASKNPLSVAVEAVIEAWPGDFVATYKIKTILNGVATRLSANSIHNYDGQIKAIVGAQTETIGSGTVIRIEGRTVAPKIKVASLYKTGYMDRFVNNALSKTDRALVRVAIEEINVEAILIKVNEALDLMES